MGERNAAVPQSLDDDAVADLIRQLQVVGRLGVLNISDTVVPTYLMAQRTAFRVEVQQPFYAPGEVFSIGEQTNPAAGTVLADTTALAAGTYDIIATLSGNVSQCRFQHRNAANAADINSWMIGNVGGTDLAMRWRWSLSLAENERLRVLNIAAPGAAVIVQVVLEVRRRA